MLCCAVLLEILCSALALSGPAGSFAVLYCWRFFAGALAGLLDALLCCIAGDTLLELYQALLDALLCCIAEDSLLELQQALLEALLCCISGDYLL